MTAEPDADKSGTGLLRRLGLLDASALVVGCVIGAGIFRLSDSVAKAADTPFLFFAAWIVGGLLSLCGALTYAELAGRFPKTGGDYVFLTNAYGRAWGFAFGWTKLFVERTGTIAIIAYVFAEHAARVFGLEKGLVKPLATAAILALTAANAAGIQHGKSVQNLFTVIKLAALVLIISVGLGAPGGDPASFTPFWPDAWSWGLWSRLGLALIPVLWTYSGWIEAAYVAEEVKDPARNLPRAIIGGLGVVCLLYLAVNFAYLKRLPLPVMAGTDLVAAAAIDGIWRGVGGRVVAAMVMASTFGALNGFILTGGRILFAIARDHALFHKLAVVSPATRTPVLSLCLNASISLVLVWTGALDQIVTYTEIVIFLFFAMSGASVFIFRRREPPVEGAYRAPLYPFVPAAFVVLCLAFAGNAIFHQPKESLLGIAVASVGFPLFFLSEKLRKASL